MYVKAIIPTIRYKNAQSAIEWLEKAFGLEVHRLVPGPQNSIAYAALTMGEVMVIISTMGKEGVFDHFTVDPQEIGGRETQCPYIVVSDPDYFYDRAKKVGARIIVEIQADLYGGRTFSCMDLEGHIWSFGSYDPWIDK